MAKSNWLSIEEITRLWGEETGLDTTAFKTDLEAWFARFVKQPPPARSLVSDTEADKTNRLMGMLGARHLERTTFEAFCRERGYKKPRFWFDDRDVRGEESDDDRPAPARPPGSGDPTASGGAGAAQTELAAFQSQIAGLSRRLETPKFDFPSFSPPPAGARSERESRQETGQASGPDTGPEDLEDEESEAPGDEIRQALLDRAASARAEADDLKAQLAAAERRIADLAADSTASGGRPAHGPDPADSAAAGSLGAGSPAPGRPTADWPPERPVARGGPGWSGPGGYRDPSVARQHLRPRPARRSGALRVALVAILAIGFVALSVWGIDTAIRIADRPPTPPPAETAASTQSGNLADRPGNGQAETPAGRASAQAPQPTGEASGDPVGDPADLAAARQQIAVLNAAVQASERMVARLQDELAIARQAMETTTREAPLADGSGWSSDERLAFQALSTEVAMARRELEEARQAAEAAAEAESHRRALLRAATTQSAELDTLRKDLVANRRQTAELSGALERANAEAESLRAELEAAGTQTAELESLRAELEAAEARAAEAESLRAELETAGTQIAELESLRAELEAAEARAAEAESARLAAEERAAEAESDRLAAVAAAEAPLANASEAERKIESLEQQLEAAFQSVAEANETAASARSATLSLRTENARLSDDLGGLDAEVRDLRAALERAEAAAAAERREPNLAATAAAARAAALQRELEAAHRRIGDLSRTTRQAEAEAARLRADLAARQAEAARPQPAAEEPLETPAVAPEPAEGSGESGGNPAADDATQPAGGEAPAPGEAALGKTALGDETGQDSAGQSEGDPADPAIDETLAAADVPADLASDPATAPAIGPGEGAAGEETAGEVADGEEADGGGAATLETSALGAPLTLISAAVPAPPPDTDTDVAPAAGTDGVAALDPEAAAQTGGPEAGLAPAELLLDPARYLGREVVVTGSVVWLLWRYRLQSDGGPGSLVIDVDGLPSKQRNDLKRAVDLAGFLGNVRARIRGRVEPEAEAGYRLSASDVAVLE